MAELAAVDVITINSVANRKFIRGALHVRPETQLPKNPPATTKLTEVFFVAVEENWRKEIAAKGAEQGEFSATAVETTGLRNCRYKDIHLHHEIQLTEGSNRQNFGPCQGQPSS